MRWKIASARTRPRRFLSTIRFGSGARQGSFSAIFRPGRNDSQWIGEVDVAGILGGCETDRRIQAVDLAGTIH
jgi:hypothetical protein